MIFQTDHPRKQRSLSRVAVGLSVVALILGAAAMVIAGCKGEANKPPPPVPAEVPPTDFGIMLETKMESSPAGDGVYLNTGTNVYLLRGGEAVRVRIVDKFSANNPPSSRPAK